MSAFPKSLTAAALGGAVVFALFASLSGAAEDSKATEKWANVQVVAYNSGLTGFFDKSTGRLYLYGADLKTPFMVTEIQALGEPLKIIKGPAGQ
jgi:hypothetical protein